MSCDYCQDTGHASGDESDPNLCGFCSCEARGIVLVTARPSDPSELVAVLGTDDDPKLAIGASVTGTDVERRFAAGATHVNATPEALDAYIESPEASARGHIWLTI